MTNRNVKLSEFVPLEKNENLKIHQYMDLEYFIRMLRTGTIYAKRKLFYEDTFEKTPPMDAAYRLSPCGENTSPQPKREERRKNIDSEYAKWAAMPTSCWTLDKRSNYLMWKTYAPHMGIRITSSLNSFISSIIDDTKFSRNKCTLHYSKMCYNDLDKIEQTAFWKEQAYSDEREFRFYFELEGDCCNTKECCGNKGINIPMNMGNLIESVTISPYINNVTAKEIEALLKCRYGINSITRIKLR